MDQVDNQEEHEIVVKKGGKSFTIKVKGSMTFDQLEAKISQEFNIPLEHQRVQILRRPEVKNVKIMGVLREKAKVKVSGTVTGGNNESSRVQWYKSHSSTLDESNLEALSNSTTVTKTFRIPLGAVGYYIVAKFTPMSSDGRSGEPTFVISNRTIEPLPPSLNFLEITGNYREGGILTASYEYVGGHEGKSIYDWYIHEDEDDFGSPIPGVSGLVEYRTTKEVIGKFISFQRTPVRDDGVVGGAAFEK